MGIKKQLPSEIMEDYVAFYKAGNAIYETTCRIDKAPIVYRGFAKLNDLRLHEKVAIKIDKGLFMATVLGKSNVYKKSSIKLESILNEKGIGLIIRRATKEDVDRYLDFKVCEDRSFHLAKSIIESKNIPMKLLHVDCTLDRDKIIFYYTSSTRVDFRSLVRELAEALKVRIEMRQVGVRDACKIVGCIGMCGRTACCCSFLSCFKPITSSSLMGMGQQDKSTGLCGRLLCCLSYEYGSNMNYCKEKENDSEQ